MNMFAAESIKGAAALARGATTKNPFEIVYSLVDENPGADKQSIFQQLSDRVADDTELQRAINYWFFCNAHSYATTSRNRKSGASNRIQTVERKLEWADKIKAQIVMLDFPMTNGKMLGDCTGAELSTMSNRYQKLADRVGKAKTVRSVLSEDQVKEILK